MIDFGQPWMLLGLLLAAVPVIVHLWGRRKAPTVPFAALAFVLQSNPRKARALRLTEWLLVAMRSLAVALMESDLAERVALLLAEDLPFAEGWRACPE